MGKVSLIFGLLATIFIAESMARNLAEHEPKYLWFPTDDGTLVKGYLEGSPKGVEADERDVRFYLYTKNNPNNPQELWIDNLDALRNSHFDSTAPVKIVSHGFSSSSVGGSAGAVKSAYVSALSKVNVICVDWAPLAVAPWYDRAAANTRMVGTKTARFLEFLVDNRATTVAQLHLIGHSLGAHVLGFTGAGLLVGRVPRITAMDPALPLFGGVSDEGRIDKGDALFVDVLHTSGGPLTSGELAFMDPRGHADYYPNGGKNQPGCTGLPEVVGACSHSRSYEFMAESIRSGGFTSCKCSSWSDFGTCNCGTTAKMGHAASASSHGYFHLTTNAQSPYSKN
jgi:hypothetical protein